MTSKTPSDPPEPAPPTPREGATRFEVAFQPGLVVVNLFRGEEGLYHWSFKPEQAHELAQLLQAASTEASKGNN